MQINEAIKVSSFRSDYETLAKRLLAVNGFCATMSYNPHNIRAYVIHNEYGVICIAIGSNLQEALDNAVDNDCLDSCLDYECLEPCYLGNASEPFNLNYIGVYAEYDQY